VGGGVVLDNAAYVVTQPKKGTYKAFTSVCTHAGCTVASVVNGRIHCGCHGSNYSASNGSVVNGPAVAPLKQFKTAVFKGKVYVTG
jgi:Rieske Fe-S protein